ncbi:MAG: geranylgeranyl reductase family protein [Nitrososphaerales archaeon]
METLDYDVIIAGGGLAGLLSAREAASKGLCVAVLEEDLEIGVPERCDGLVSMKALMELGVIPSSRAVQNTVKRVLIYPPNGKPLEADISKQNIIVLHRSIFDKELAKTALSRGAELYLGERVYQAVEKEGYVEVKAKQTFNSKVYIDARGTTALPPEKQNSLLPAARYDIEAEWINQDTVEIYLDNLRYPGFFLWVIPTSRDTAKLGVAGRSINCFSTLDEFLKRRGGYPTKKVSAPIYVGGPVEKFVNGRIMLVGDSAGQTKPSTGGGIYLGGLGGVLSGQAAAAYILDGEEEALQRYSQRWLSLLEDDIRTTLYARRLFEKLDNKSLEKIFNLLRKKEVLNSIFEEGDFDRHSKSIRQLLGVEGIVKLFSIIASNEVKALFKQIEGLLNKKGRTIDGS